MPRGRVVSVALCLLLSLVPVGGELAEVHLGQTASQGSVCRVPQQRGQPARPTAFVQNSFFGGHLVPGNQFVKDRHNTLSVKCDLHRDDVVTKKDTLRVPATSILSWREYRARLIQSETPLWMRRGSLNAGVFAHEIVDIEKGCLLVEVPQADGSVEHEVGEQKGEEAEYRVIFLVQYDAEHGSYGLVLNKPTPCSIGDFTEKLPQFSDNVIHFGGEGHRTLEGQGPNRELHALHSVRGLLGSEEVIDGVFVGADVKHAGQLVHQRKARSSQFKFFYSATCWSPGELESEVEEGKWVAVSCSKELILQPSSYWEKPLWNTILGLMGGKHGLLSREISDSL